MIALTRACVRRRRRTHILESLMILCTPVLRHACERMLGHRRRRVHLSSRTTLTQFPRLANNSSRTALYAPTRRAHASRIVYVFRASVHKYVLVCANMYAFCAARSCWRGFSPKRSGRARIECMSNVYCQCSVYELAGAIARKKEKQQLHS